MRPRRLIEFYSGRVRLNFWRRRTEWAQIYLEPRDWWVGVFVGEHAVFICPLPCLVVKVWRHGWLTREVV